MDSESTSLQSKLASWRRHLHQYPELGFDEQRTSIYIAKRLKNMGIEVHTGVGGTGVVGTINFSTVGPSIALRAELDALPLTEDANCRPHISLLPGRMHACGHDGHMAMVLGAAALLKDRTDLRGTVQLIFQPDEETGKGAQAMIDDGLFERFPIDEIYALHNMPGFPAGLISTKPAGIMAGEDQFRITISGKQSHAAAPHTGFDTIVCGGHLIVALQTVVSRSVDPSLNAVLSCTRIASEGANNVIAGKTVIEGTVRTFDASVQALIRKRIDDISRNIGASMGCSSEVCYEVIVAPTINTDSLVEEVRSAACEINGDSAHSPAPGMMTSEDFGVFLKHRPGNFAFIGNGQDQDNGGRPLHNSRYDFNDELLDVGARYYEALVARRLQAKASA
jgi:hippurate hydrolase